MRLFSRFFLTAYREGRICLYSHPECLIRAWRIARWKLNMSQEFGKGASRG